MTLLRFEPLKDFDRLTDQIEKYLSATNSAFSQSAILPLVDIYETKDKLNVELEAAGIKKEDLKIVLEDNILTITGEKKSTERNNLVKNFRGERSYGKFKRSFTLPVDVNPDKVNANFEDGVLKINLSKREVESVTEKTIELK